MRWPALLLAGLAFAIGLTACGDDDDGDSSGGGRDVVIGYSAPTIQPSQTAIVDGMEDAAGKLGWEVKSLNAQLKADKQASDLQTFLTQGVDAIALSALDPNALAGAYQEARQEGVLTVGLETGGPDINTDVKWEQFNCYEDGSAEQSVDYVKERIPDAKVMVIGGPPFEGITVRTECFVEKAEAAGLEVVAREDNLKDTADAAQPIVASVLQRHPDIDAILSYNDSSALGASAALTAANKKVWSGDQEGVIVIGANADIEAIEAIRQGRMTGTWDPQYKEMGYAVIKVLRPVLEEGKKPDAMPKEIAIDNILWDSTNVDEYLPAQQRKVSFDDLPLIDPKTGQTVE